MTPGAFRMACVIFASMVSDEGAICSWRDFNPFFMGKPVQVGVECVTSLEYHSCIVGSSVAKL